MKSFLKHNLFLSFIYALRLHYYTLGGMKYRVTDRLYQQLLNKGKSDSVIRSHTNGQLLFCNFAHQLPFYQKAYPFYDRQLPKLCHYMHNKLKRQINIIDVGANVGDTVLNIGISDAFYLCIEGNGYFSQCLKMNLKKYHYSLEKCFLSDNNKEQSYRLTTSKGTGHLVKNNKGVSELTTLDNLITKNYPDVVFDLLKIDTDGFDFKVIRGAKQYLQHWSPLLFFEWDKAYCKEQGEDPLAIFPVLYDLGYKNCILFDNFGNPNSKVKSLDSQKLKNLINKTHGDGLPFYYDVLAVPEKGLFDISNLYSLFFDSENAQ